MSQKEFPQKSLHFSHNNIAVIAILEFIYFRNALGIIDYVGTEKVISIFFNYYQNRLGGSFISDLFSFGGNMVTLSAHFVFLNFLKCHFQ